MILKNYFLLIFLFLGKLAFSQNEKINVAQVLKVNQIDNILCFPNTSLKNLYHYKILGQKNAVIDSILISSYSFDKNGNLVAFENYGEGSILNFKEIFKWDLKSNLLVKERTANDGSVIFREEYIYNKWNKITESNFFNSEGTLISQEVVLYNNLGDIEKKTLIDLENNERQIQIFEKNNNENFIIKKTYKRKNRLENTQLKKYNESGKIIELKETNGCGKQTYCEHYEYDDEQRVVKKFYKTSKDIQGQINYLYDSAGHITEELHFKNATLYNLKSYEFDDSCRIRYKNISYLGFFHPKIGTEIQHEVTEIISRHVEDQKMIRSQYFLNNYLEKESFFIYEKY